LGLQPKHTAGGGVTRRSAAADFQSDAQYLVTLGRWAASTWACKHPSAQRFRTDADIRADRLAGGRHRPILAKVIEHHLHRALTPLDRVMLGHRRHPSHTRKRHQTQNGSFFSTSSVLNDSGHGHATVQTCPFGARSASRGGFLTRYQSTGKQRELVVHNDYLRTARRCTQRLFSRRKVGHRRVMSALVLRHDCRRGGDELLPPSPRPVTQSITAEPLCLSRCFTALRSIAVNRNATTQNPLEISQTGCGAPQ